jgi:predicted DsbA family dithiol-disulfide isomerase
VNHLKNVASGLGLPFGGRTMTFNSRRAQELGKWAESKGKGDEFHDAMFRANFADGKNIGTLPVLMEVAESIELNGGDAMQIIKDGTYKDSVDLDWQRSRELRITAVPTFVMNRHSLVGAQKYDALEMLLLSNAVEKRIPPKKNS